MRPTWTPALALVLAACAAPADPPPPIPDPVPLSGTYQVSSLIDVPAMAAVPGTPGDALRLVDDLAQNPAAAILDLAESADVPALGTIRAILPETLASQLEGWINAVLSTSDVNGVAPMDQLSELDGVIRSVLLRFELRSELDLVAGQGTHSPVAIAFDVLDQPVVVQVDETAPVTGAAGVVANVTWPEGEAGPVRVEIGDHAMGVPYGHYAMEALATVLDATYGASDVRGAVGLIVDCGAVAQSVASRCVLGLCVGHATELQEICEGGLDEAADQLEARILAFDYQAIRFEAGTAGVTGLSIEGGAATAEALSSGVWTATVDLGQGAEEANATFTAVR
jgi:hypothetical protein